MRSTLLTLGALLALACEPSSGGPKAAVEDCENLKDDDDDGFVDCADDDCLGSCPENCTDLLDNDGDELIDCFDPDCDGLCTEICDDARDNDGDGLTDCEDRDCFGVCPEVCDDGFDNDGDGLTDCLDEDCNEPECPESCSDGRDNDTDGLVDCEDPDCVGPSCDEICDDGRDNDGDGRADCDDSDCDGDCPEICDDKRDNDADGFIDCEDDECTAVCDADGDGYYNAEYGGDDCDDTRFEVNPSRPEICNGDEVLDDNCNGLIDELDPAIDITTLIGWYPDNDEDGHGGNTLPEWACQQPEGRAAGNLDCDDDNPYVNPDMPEICNPDGPLDDDCDGRVDDADDDISEDSYLTWYADTDEDSYGALGDSFDACAAPDGYAANSDDCDDTDPWVGPPSVWYPDGDGDGYGVGDPYSYDLFCDAPADGYAPDWRGLDCDDVAPDIHPDGEEICEDGIDQDCDGEDLACAQFLYAADGSGSSGGLWEIDTYGGTVTEIARLAEPITGLAFDEDWNLYSVSGEWTYHGRVHEIDIPSGTMTFLGPTVDAECSIGFTGGLLYVADWSTDFLSLDPATGTSTRIGFGGGFGGSGYGYDLAGDAFGTLWYGNEDELYTVDPATGNFTLAGPITGIPITQGGAMTFHDGELWLTADDGGGTTLYTVDLVTGAATSTGITIPSSTIDALASPTW